MNTTTPLISDAQPSDTAVSPSPRGDGVVTAGLSHPREDESVVTQALALLASLPDIAADNLGLWRDEDGELAHRVTRDEWAEGLRDGSVGPDAFIRNARLIEWVTSDPATARAMRRGALHLVKDGDPA